MQSRYRKTLNRAGMTGALLLASVLSLPAAPDSAPDFTLKSASGVNLKLSEFRGEVVLINFWASWCGPCRQEMPLLSELHDSTGLGFTVLGVNVEEDTAGAQAAGGCAGQFSCRVRQRQRVAEYDVAAMPSTMLVDRNGTLRYLHKGYKPGLEAVYQQQVRDLLRE